MATSDNTGGGGGGGGDKAKSGSGKRPKDHRKILGLATLCRLDEGVAQGQFDRLMVAATQDCMDRPGEKTARKVTLTLLLTPDGTDNVCDRVKVEYEFSTSVPKFRTREYHAATHANGSLLFSPSSPDDPNQMGMFDGDGND
ncbi:MAG: hypothetical protein IOD15_00125 [Phycisphaerales bacterium]|nr:hypothetical protein [Phycisphaerales bacterium]